MSNETKPLMAEEFYQDCAFLVPGRNLAVITVDDAYEKMQEQTAALREKLTAYESGGHTLIPTTELAAMREEAEFRANTADFFMEDRQRHRELCKDLALKNKNLVAELEAVKKELGNERARQISFHTTIADKAQTIRDWQNSYYALKPQLDEAVKLLKDEFPVIVSILEEADGAVDFQGTASHDTEPEAKAWELKWRSCVERLRTGISRLSSGETKPSESTNTKPE